MSHDNNNSTSKSMMPEPTLTDILNQLQKLASKDDIHEIKSQIIAAKRETDEQSTIFINVLSKLNSNRPIKPRELIRLRRQLNHLNKTS